MWVLPRKVQDLVVAYMDRYELKTFDVPFSDVRGGPDGCGSFFLFVLIPLLGVGLITGYQLEQWGIDPPEVVLGAFLAGAASAFTSWWPLSWVTRGYFRVSNTADGLWITAISHSNRGDCSGSRDTSCRVPIPPHKILRCMERAAAGKDTRPLLMREELLRWAFLLLKLPFLPLYWTGSLLLGVGEGLWSWRKDHVARDTERAFKRVEAIVKLPEGVNVGDVRGGLSVTEVEGGELSVAREPGALALAPPVEGKG